MREICLLAAAAAAVPPCLGSVTWLLPVSAASRCPQATTRLTLGSGTNVWRWLVQVEQIVLKASTGEKRSLIAAFGKVGLLLELWAW